MNYYDKIVLRAIYWLIGMAIISYIAVSMVLYFAQYAKAAECVPPRIEGPSPGTKVGGEYGQLPTLQNRQVILTLDDGPHPRNSPIIQSILKSNCISAVFFFIGKEAQRYPNLVRDAAANGHVIGSHSYSHLQPFAHYSNDRTSAEIDNGIKAIKEAGPYLSPYFRYPGLSHNKYTEQFTVQKGLTVWSADVDPWDWAEPGTSKVVNRIMSQLKDKHRGIIVLHENHSSTVAALPVIIQSLRDNGYEIVGIR